MKLISTRIKLTALLGLLALPMSASAVVFNEIGDAGQLTGTAQLLPGGTSQVLGNVGAGDADLFKFTWGGGNFYANTTGSNFDSQLFLFDAAGVGVQGNDDGIAFAGPAFLQLGNLMAGSYFLGVSGFDFDPSSASGLIFQSAPFGPLYGPNNLDPLDSWGGGAGGGSYAINFQQVTNDGTPIGDPNPTGVPDAANTLALFGMSLSGLAWLRRKSR